MEDLTWCLKDVVVHIEPAPLYTKCLHLTHNSKFKQVNHVLCIDNYPSERKIVLSAKETSHNKEVDRNSVGKDKASPVRS
jgi:hypothetical protein